MGVLDLILGLKDQSDEVVAVLTTYFQYLIVDSRIIRFHLCLPVQLGSVQRIALFNIFARMGIRL